MKAGILWLCVATQVWFASSRRTVSRHHMGSVDNVVLTEEPKPPGFAHIVNQYYSMCKATLTKLEKLIAYDESEGIASDDEVALGTTIESETSSSADASTKSEDWVDMLDRIETLLSLDLDEALEASDSLITTHDLNILNRCSRNPTEHELEDVEQTEEGLRIIQGDIVVPPPDESDDEPMNSSSSALEQGEEWWGRKHKPKPRWAGRLWTDNEIPWCFHSKGVDEKVMRTWRTTLANIEARTCVRFKEIAARSGTEHCSTTPSVIVQSHEEGCWSYVGMIGRRGSQKLNLQHGTRGTCATNGIVAHEVGHTMGMSHEQSRADRDTHVTIMWDNIDKDKQNNFEIDGAFTGDDYDIFSLMHYGAYDFGLDRSKVTIKAANSEHSKIMGQRVGFSAQDIRQINKMYNCHADPSFVFEERPGGKELLSGSRCHAKENFYKCNSKVTSSLPVCSSISKAGKNMLCRDPNIADCPCLGKLTRTKQRGSHQVTEDLTCDQATTVKMYHKDGRECQNVQPRRHRRNRRGWNGW